MAEWLIKGLIALIVLLVVLNALFGVTPAEVGGYLRTFWSAMTAG